MKRAEHMKITGKENDIQERMREREWICISNGWMRWAKKYLNRVNRRKLKNTYVNIDE